MQVPVLRITRPKKLQWDNTGVALFRKQKYGESEQEALMALAPEDASTPEKMVYGWLVRQDIPFGFQVEVEGGRVPGGAVIDFVIYLREPELAIRVMGYWHEMLIQKVRDDLQLDSLIQLGYEVVDIWDYEVNTVDKLERKMMEVLYGIKRQPAAAGSKSSTVTIEVGSWYNAR
jgi:G:T-mismatch repair DNA endonuclease (very short patch repair protein)